MKNGVIKNEKQVALFSQIKQVLPPNHSLVDVIADLLGIRTDAAYRRIRGDKPIDFEEAIKLCKHFQISMDLFANVKKELV